ncbi:MAG: CoB--CoM heterodisulfide reductase iron-sulfur subunit B family protein [Bacillota bacterium]
MKLAYYPGCSLSSTAREYGESTEAVARALDIELVQLPDWNCCGATSAHSTSHALSLGLPARNLAIAKRAGLDLMAPCAACYNRFAATEHAVVNDTHTRELVGSLLGEEYTGGVKVLNLVTAIAACGEAAVTRRTVRPLKGIKVACYYGCLLVRPQEVTGHPDPEYPEEMDRLLAAAGAEPVDWAYKTECCGASLSLSRTDIVLKLSRDILEAAREAGADCIATACPLCQTNLDMRQPKALKMFKLNYRLPVFFFTQLLGLGFGLGPGELGLQRHSVDVMRFVRARRLA